MHYTPMPSHTKVEIFQVSTYTFSADMTPEMLKLCRVTKVKVFFLVLVYILNFDLFEFSSATLEKGLFPLIKSPFHHSIVMEVRIYSYHYMDGKWKLILMGRGELRSQTSKQMMMTMMVTMMVMGSWIIYGTTHLIIMQSSITRSDHYFNY